MNQSLLRRAIPHLAALVAFALVSIFFFSPQLQNKKLRQGDIENFKGMASEIKQHHEETGDYPLWTNSMFGGMPSYQILSPQKGNVFQYIETVFKLGFDRPIGYFIYGMIAFYILMLVLGVNPWLAIIASISFSLMTNNLVLFEAGHNTKVRAIMSSPIILAGVLGLSQRRYWLGGGLFALGMGLNLYANHYQMTYYLGLVILILVIMEVVIGIRAKAWDHLLKSAGIMLFGVLIGFGTSAVKLLPTYEYGQDTMRGDPILTADGEADDSGETDGLAWDYAMNWSNGAADILSSFVPGVVGGSSAEEVDKDSAFAKELRRRGMRDTKNMAAPLYFGGLPSTSGPIYFGAIIFFLMVMGFFIVPGHWRWWILAAVVLTLLLSMGRNLEGFNRFIFDAVPFYNKFRTPNSILSITTVLVPLFAFFGYSQILKKEDKSSMLMPLYVCTGVFSLILLYLAVIAPSSWDLAGASDGRYPAEFSDILKADRASLMSSDAWRSLILILAFAGTLWFYLKKKLGHWPLIIIGGLLIMIDIFGVGRRYIDHDDFISERQLKAQLNPRKVDELIMKDSDQHFRVLDTSIPTFVSSFASNFHKTIGGNHAAKLQRIEDIKNRHINEGNMSVLNMLNAKYFIQATPGSEEATFNLNTAALGNAWYVNELRFVPDANAEIAALSDFDPAGTAIIHEEYRDYCAGLDVRKAGTIELKSYEPDRLVYQSNSTAEQFAVFSEVWYGPDKGWLVTVDGEQSDHIRVNYILRGMRVPAGQHEIIFEFDPPIYRTGAMISTVSSVILLLGFAFGLYQQYRQSRSEPVST